MDIFTPPTSTLPGNEANDTPWPLAMPIAQRAMDVLQHKSAQTQTPQNGPSRSPGRVLILCFDGDGNKFGEVGVKIRFQLHSMPNIFAVRT